MDGEGDLADGQRPDVQIVHLQHALNRAQIRLDLCREKTDGSEKAAISRMQDGADLGEVDSTRHRLHQHTQAVPKQPHGGEEHQDREQERGDGIWQGQVIRRVEGAS